MAHAGRVFLIEEKQITSLDDLLNDAISDPVFTVIAPDKVKVDLYFKSRF